MFALSMEYQTRCMTALEEDPTFHYHRRCKRVKLTHLIFAYDLLLFSRGDVGSVKDLLKQFKEFVACSRLQANLEKSKVYCAGICDDLKYEICEELGMDAGRLPLRYFGVLLAGSKLLYNECRPLLIQITQKIYIELQVSYLMGDSYI